MSKLKPLSTIDTAQQIVSDNPLAMEYETDARDIWPRRYELLRLASRAREEELEGLLREAVEGGNSYGCERWRRQVKQAIAAGGDDENQSKA